MRIVSLLASGTEIVCALGAGTELVGRSHECDNPAWVGELPACTGPAFEIETSSGAIDREVRRLLKEGLPLYHIHSERIAGLFPDLLITQEHCDVCAVTPGDLARANCGGLAREVLALGAGTVTGIYDGIFAIGRALGRGEAANELVSNIRLRIDEVRRAISHRPPPTVAILEWTDPIFPAGNWIPELVEAANGRLVFGGKGEHSSATPWARICQADPSVLIIAPCGYNLERSLREIPFLEQLPGWFELQSVKNRRVAFADGNRFFNRSGTTIVETTEILAEILHEYHGVRPWEGTAWQRYKPGSPSLALESVSAFC